MRLLLASQVNRAKKKFLTMRHKASQCCNRATKLAPISNFLFRNRALIFCIYLCIFVRNPTRPFDAIAQRQKNINTSIRKFRMLVVYAQRRAISEFCNRSKSMLHHISNSLGRGLILYAHTLACFL